MAQQLRATTIDLKSFDQDIPDPIVAGGADADGRTFRILFDQEAAAQLTDNSKLYLSWNHQQNKVRGYNVFDKVKDEDPQTWEIKWPQKMLREGDVLCCIELVDEVSIVQSQNFTVHVLSDPNDGSEFVLGDDYTVFQQAVIDMNSLAAKVEDRIVALEAGVSSANDEIEAIKTKLESITTRIDAFSGKMDTAIESIDGKLDVSKVGFEFDDDVKTIKDYIDAAVKLAMHSSS